MFKNTKFPAIDNKIKQLLVNQEETLAYGSNPNSRKKEEYIYSI